MIEDNLIENIYKDSVFQKSLKIIILCVLLIKFSSLCSVTTVLVCV